MNMMLTTAAASLAAATPVAACADTDPIFAAMRRANVALDQQAARIAECSRIEEATRDLLPEIAVQIEDADREPPQHWTVAIRTEGRPDRQLDVPPPAERRPIYLHDDADIDRNFPGADQEVVRAKYRTALAAKIEAREAAETRHGLTGATQEADVAINEFDAAWDDLFTTEPTTAAGAMAAVEFVAGHINRDPSLFYGDNPDLGQFVLTLASASRRFGIAAPLATPQQRSDADPIFATLGRHRAAVAVYLDAVDISASLTSDSPNFAAASATTDRAFAALDAAGAELAAATQATTLAGVVALLSYVAERSLMTDDFSNEWTLPQIMVLDRQRGCLRQARYIDGGTPEEGAQTFPYFLMRSVAEAIERIEAGSMRTKHAPRNAT